MYTRMLGPPPSRGSHLNQSCLQLTAKALYDAGITWKDIFTEIPIKIENTPLVTALMAEIDRQTVLDSITASRLRLNTLPFLEKQLELMGDGIESLYMEVQDVTKYERARVRMEQAKAAWLARRQEVRPHLPTSHSLLSQFPQECSLSVYMPAPHRTELRDCTSYCSEARSES